MLFLTITFFITSCCSKFPDLGEGYRLDSDGKYTTQIVNSENTIMISSHILLYAFDSTFIIASQRPWNVVLERETMTYKESNKAFEKSKFRQYWIINKKKKSEYSLDSLSQLARYSNVYGPFTRKEYLKKRKELGLPLDLRLKE